MSTNSFVYSYLKVAYFKKRFMLHPYKFFIVPINRHTLNIHNNIGDWPGEKPTFIRREKG